MPTYASARPLQSAMSLAMSSAMSTAIALAMSLAITAMPLRALAQTQDPPQKPSGWQGGEIYASSHALSDGYGDWHEAGLRGIYQNDAHIFGGEISTMTRFNEKGNFLGVSDTVILSPEWYAFLGVGAGDGAAYLPRYRVDAFIHRKLLSEKNLIVSLGAGTYRAPDGHQDNNVSIGMTLYTAMPLIIQAEAKRTRSNPGRIQTDQFFVAATWGHDKQTRIIGRYGWGDEGYQSLGADMFISRFASRQTNLTVKHWLGRDWGIKAGAERYKNPFYQRNGLSLALFKDWS